MGNKQFGGLRLIPALIGRLTPAGDTGGAKSKPGRPVSQEVAQTGAVTGLIPRCVPVRHTGDQNGMAGNQS
jgi:hypothetical protein